MATTERSTSIHIAGPPRLMVPKKSAKFTRLCVPPSARVKVSARGARADEAPDNTKDGGTSPGAGLGVGGPGVHSWSFALRLHAELLQRVGRIGRQLGIAARVGLRLLQVRDRRGAVVAVRRCDPGDVVRVRVVR